MLAWLKNLFKQKEEPYKPAILKAWHYKNARQDIMLENSTDDGCRGYGFRIYGDGSSERPNVIDCWPCWSELMHGMTAEDYLNLRWYDTDYSAKVFKRVPREEIQKFLVALAKECK